MGLGGSEDQRKKTNSQRVKTVMAQKPELMVLSRLQIVSICSELSSMEKPRMENRFFNIDIG